MQEDTGHSLQDNNLLQQGNLLHHQSVDRATEDGQPKLQPEDRRKNP